MKHFIWHWCCHQGILCNMEVYPRFPGRPQKSLRHWLGRSSSHGAWPSPCHPVSPPMRQQHFGTFRQFQNHFRCEHGPFSEQRDKQDPQTCILASSKGQHSSACIICSKSQKHCRCPFVRSNFGVSTRFPIGTYQSHHSTPRSPNRQANTLVVAALLTPPITPCLPDLSRSSNGLLQLCPSSLRPSCKAEERLFKWIRVNQPPASTINNLVIRYLADLASQASLRDTGNYSSGL
jgi:hypothetical protein